MPEAAPAVGTEAAQIVALWQACGLTRPWNDPHADFARALAGAHSAVLVIRDAGAILAAVMVGEDGHRGWVYYLAVDPSHRGHGLGAAMMDAAERWLRQRGTAKIQFMVREDNAATIAFYRTLGYEHQPVVTMGRFLDQPATEQR